MKNNEVLEVSVNAVNANAVNANDAASFKHALLSLTQDYREAIEMLGASLQNCAKQLEDVDRILRSLIKRVEKVEEKCGIEDYV